MLLIGDRLPGSRRAAGRWPRHGGSDCPASRRFDCPAPEFDEAAKGDGGSKGERGAGRFGCREVETVRHLGPRQAAPARCTRRNLFAN